MKTVHILLIASLFACNILGAAAPRTINYTPFFEATACGDRESIKNFLKDNKDIDINHRDVSHGMTALYLASFFDDDIELVELLLNNGANPDKGSITPETDEDYFANEDDSEKTPLLLACENKSITLVKLLLVKGADVNKRNRLCGTPLHVAVKSGDKEMVRVLLEWGAHKDAKNAYGKTAVERAREDGDNDLADFVETWEPLDIKEPVID